MKPWLVFLPALALASCSEQAATPAEPPGAVNPAPPAPPAAQPPTYIGRWAARTDLCADGAWEFQEKSLATAGEVSCAFDTVTATDTGWIAEGRCTAQGQPAPATLVLNTVRPGPVRTLAVSGGPFVDPPVLTACPAEKGPGAVNPAPATADRGGATGSP